MIVEDEATARLIAERLLDEDVRPDTDEEIVVTSARQFRRCWVVGYNTRAYVGTGSISHTLAGGGPIIINRMTGRARMGTSALPVEEQLDEV